MIKRLRVKNYKSLKDLDLPLRPLTIFVGPNNAGKSNILDALLLLADFVNEGAVAVSDRGGFADIVWNGELDRTISITLEGGLRWAGKKKFLYEVELVGDPKRWHELRLPRNQNFALNKELFTVSVDKEQRTLLAFNGPGQSCDVFDEQGKHLLGMGGGNPTELFLKHCDSPEHYGPLLVHFSRSVSEWSDYVLDTVQMRGPSAARHDLRLHSLGQNLSSVLLTLQTEHSKQFQRIEEVLKLIVPEMEHLYIRLTPEGETYVCIHEQGLSKEIPLWALSDGTLHTLGTLAALYNPNPPTVMCFEEPENFVHPRVLEVLAEDFREASQHSQILICTHSPYFLDHFRPEDLVIVEKVKGSTQARRATGQKGMKEALRVLGLGEFWYSGAMGGVPRSES